MASLEHRREVSIQRLGAAYEAGSLGTGTFEDRVQAVLRAGSPAAVAAPLWDLAARGDSLRRALQRARWTLDLASGRVGPPSGHVSVDLCALAARSHRRSLVVGRAPGCDVLLELCPSVSRRHAELSLRGGRWTLRDLGSLNGTWLGARRVDAVALDPRLPVRLGRLEIHWTGA